MKGSFLDDDNAMNVLSKKTNICFPKEKVCQQKLLKFMEYLESGNLFSLASKLKNNQIFRIFRIRLNMILKTNLKRL